MVVQYGWFHKQCKAIMFYGCSSIGGSGLIYWVVLNRDIKYHFINPQLEIFGVIFIKINKYGIAKSIWTLDN